MLLRALLVCGLLLGLPAEAATKNILITGYWPPSNEMLRDFSPKDPSRWQGKNWRGLGYDIYAYFPENTEGTEGVGEGDFRVDFASVYNDFMQRTEELRPVAIVSFGRGAGPWEIETNFPAYYKAWYLRGNIPTVVGESLLYSVPESLALDKALSSSLPVEAIREAVEKLGKNGLKPWVDTKGDAGDFVCGFTGYLGAWYHEQHKAADDPFQNKAAGFIHVNGDLKNARASLEVSLEALIHSLREGDQTSN